MLATVLGVEFNPNSSWDEKREIWRIADVIYQTKEVTADRRRPQGRPLDHRRSPPRSSCHERAREQVSPPGQPAPDRPARRHRAATSPPT